MSPQRGDKIAHYRLTSKLGEGGMGEVYRATDTKLEPRRRHQGAAASRSPQDPERMARFEREAQVLASLNHPNIAAIYGVEQGALVMELVEGENLQGSAADRDGAELSRGRSRRALEAAHEKGIIHRDLKPANIKVTPEGAGEAAGFRTGQSRRGESRRGVPPAPPISPTLVADHDAGGHDPGHRGLHVARSRRAASRWTSAPTSGRSAWCSTRC